MAKISIVSAKYIIHATIEIEGVVDRPDVIEAIFGQTEGLLGADLELRELQRSGRIGRIEVNVDTRSGKTTGEIIVPSSLDKSETSIIAAALEVIQRIGPCNAKIYVTNIEDVRVSKRTFIVERAKELLKNLIDKVLDMGTNVSAPVRRAAPAANTRSVANTRRVAAPVRQPRQERRVVAITADEKSSFKEMLDDLIGTRGAYILDESRNIMGKVPITELPTTIRSLSTTVYAIVFDGIIDRDLLRIAEKASVNYLVAMDSKIKPNETKVRILTANDF